jgi:hypothetical protein
MALSESWFPPWFTRELFHSTHLELRLRKFFELWKYGTWERMRQRYDRSVDEGVQNPMEVGTFHVPSVQPPKKRRWSGEDSKSVQTRPPPCLSKLFKAIWTHTLRKSTTRKRSSEGSNVLKDIAEDIKTHKSEFKKGWVEMVDDDVNSLESVYSQSLTTFHVSSIELSEGMVDARFD